MRCMCGDNPKRRSPNLALVEWWYNTNYHNNVKLTLFQLLYGYLLVIHLSYDAIVDLLLTNREDTIRMLKFHLRRAQ